MVVVVSARCGTAALDEATRHQSEARLRDIIGAGRIVAETSIRGRARSSAVTPGDRRRVCWPPADWTLLGLWADGEHVHMALADEDHNDFGVLSVECEDRRFPSVGQSHPPAIRLERAIRDLWGLEPEGLADAASLARSWHVESSAQPPRPARNGRAGPEPTPSCPPTVKACTRSRWARCMRASSNPVTSGSRRTARPSCDSRRAWATCTRALEWLMEGMSIDRAAVLAGRVSGDSTVAYALAFARAIEAAHGIEVPRRAVWLRALMASSNDSPITSATSARSATMPPLP